MLQTLLYKYQIFELPVTIQSKWFLKQQNFGGEMSGAKENKNKKIDKTKGQA